MKWLDEIQGAGLILLVVFFLGYMTGFWIKSNLCAGEAIKNNCAGYNNRTGVFEWKKLEEK